MTTRECGGTFAIRHKITGNVLFEAQLPAEISAEPSNIKLGAAIKLAVKAGANLSGADLSGADLRGADLGGSNLSGSNLSGSNLSGSNLSGSNLRDADLSGSNLSGSNLRYAYLSGAYLSGVKDVIAGGQPNGYWAYGWREKNTGMLLIKIGIGRRDKTIAEAREYWSPSHPYWGDLQEIPAALDMIEAIARLRGWLS